MSKLKKPSKPGGFFVYQMSHIKVGSVHTYYQYSGGHRVRKYSDTGYGTTEERIYYGTYEVYRRDNGSKLIERTTLHVSDDAGRIATIQQRTIGDKSDDRDTPGLLSR